MTVYFVGLHVVVMINRNGWGYSYSIVRGEILGFMEDELAVGSDNKHERFVRPPMRVHLGIGAWNGIGTGIVGTIGYVVLPTGVSTDVSRDIV